MIGGVTELIKQVFPMGELMHDVTMLVIAIAALYLILIIRVAAKTS
ncbi:MAG: hypothetical protein NXY59_10175 [Aigarchaeota archaeon]|nr:hypothetical protein [Candidatus Pelearchaeum maunauluense]